MNIVSFPAASLILEEIRNSSDLAPPHSAVLTQPSPSPRLFFRRHYPINTVTFCDVDPQDRK